MYKHQQIIFLVTNTTFVVWEVCAINWVERSAMNSIKSILHKCLPSAHFGTFFIQIKNQVNLSDTLWTLYSSQLEHHMGFKTRKNIFPNRLGAVAGLHSKQKVQMMISDFGGTGDDLEGKNLIAMSNSYRHVCSFQVPFFQVWGR